MMLRSRRSKNFFPGRSNGRLTWPRLIYTVAPRLWATILDQSPKKIGPVFKIRQRTVWNCIIRRVVHLLELHFVFSRVPGKLAMGNKPVAEKKGPKRGEVMLKIVPPVDQAYLRWLIRDLEMIHGYTVRNCPAVKPPDHYIEYMKLNGMLDVDINDPDLLHLFQAK